MLPRKFTCFFESRQTIESWLFPIKECFWKLALVSCDYIWIVFVEFRILLTFFERFLLSIVSFLFFAAHFDSYNRSLASRAGVALFFLLAFYKSNFRAKTVANGGLDLLEIKEFHLLRNHRHHWIRPSLWPQTPFFLGCKPGQKCSTLTVKSYLKLVPSAKMFNISPNATRTFQKRTNGKLLVLKLLKWEASSRLMVNSQFIFWKDYWFYFS